MALNCPRCRPTTLQEIELGDVPIDRCPRCGGLWFDNAEVSEMTGLKAELAGFESIVPPMEFTQQQMNCPRCDDVELRKMSIPGKLRQQVLYRCISCLGTWIDRGELREEEDPNLLNAVKAYFSKTRVGNEER